LIGDAKAAADKLRAAGLTEEAALMDEMVVKLEGALQAHYDAHDLKHTAGPIDEGDLAAVLHQVLSSSRHLCKSLHSDGDDDIAQFVDVFKFGVERLSSAYTSSPECRLVEESRPGDAKLDVSSMKGFKIGDNITVGSGAFLEALQIAELDD